MTENQQFEYVPLDLVDSNPWSCRLSEDPEHVKKVAISIASEGLMQFPIGRRVNGRIQLAFGHTRLAAYKLLLSETKNPGFETVPVIIRSLDDDEMFQYGISENLVRKDLTPIEEATAMKRYQEEFHKTSVEVGALFNLSDSAVRNKIRLLQLPEDIRQKLAEAKISEGAARALLELFDLPEELRKSAESYYYENGKPSEIIKNALSGQTADEIRQDISNMIQRFSQDLSGAKWKWDEVFTGDVHLVGPCKGCQFLVKNDKKSLCLKNECFKAKERIVKQRYLEEASQISGIKVREGDLDTSLTKFQYNNKQALELAKSIKCPNLRLIYDEYEYHNDDDDHLKSIGFPRAQIVCGKQQQWCSCIQAVKAGLQDALVEKVSSPEKGAEPEYIPVEDSADPGIEVIHINPSIPVTLDQLKEVSRAARQKKKENLEDIKGMEQEAAKIVAAGLMDINNPKIWLVLLDTMNWSGAQDIERESKGDYSDNPIAWCDEIRYLIGTALILRIAQQNYYYNEPNSNLSLQRLNNYLKKAGLRELESVSAETEKIS